MSVTLEAGIVGRSEETLIEFYTNVMGFALEESLGFPIGDIRKLRRDAARLKLFFPTEQVDDATHADPWFRPGGWRYAALRLERLTDVDALTQAVQKGGGTVLLTPTSHKPDGRTAVIADPEGNAWELLAEAKPQE
jgi:predicted enzyme related to lactoylglutathione lyase